MGLSTNVVYHISQRNYGCALVRRRLRDFAAREQDETGFVFMRSRYYDPDMGRFVCMPPFASTVEPTSTLM